MTSKKFKKPSEPKEKTWLSTEELNSIVEGRGVGVYGAVGGDISDAEKANLEKKAEKFGLTPKWKQEGGTSPEKK